MEAPQPVLSTYDRDKLLQYEHIPSAFLRHFAGILEIVIYLLIICNVALFVVNCYLENEERQLGTFFCFIILCHWSGEMYGKGTFEDGYWIAANFLSCMLILTLWFVYLLPPKSILGVGTVTVVLILDLATFLFMYLKAHYWVIPVKPFAPLPGFVMEDRNNYDNGSLVVVRSRAHEVILDNITDEDIDLSRAILKRRSGYLHYDWKIRLPPGTIIQANSYLQIVPWGADDEPLCSIGLRGDTTERRMQRLFYPMTKKSFQGNESEDHLIQTSLAADGKQAYLYETWRLPQSDKQ